MVAGKPFGGVEMIKAIAIGTALGLVAAAILFRLSEQFDEGLAWF